MNGIDQVTHVLLLSVAQCAAVQLVELLKQRARHLVLGTGVRHFRHFFIQRYRVRGGVGLDWEAVRFCCKISAV